MPKDYIFEGEDLTQELIKLVKELKQEVIGEFRLEIKQTLRSKIRKELAELGMVDIDDGSDVPELAEEIIYRPEVTALSRNITRLPDSEISYESNMYITTLDTLQSTAVYEEKQAESLLYTYCFTKQANLKLEKIKDLSGRFDFSIVKVGNILAVVSQVSADEFGEEALESKIKDFDWVKDTVKVHESVIEQVMSSGPVVPLKFCTIFRTEARVKEFIHNHYDSLNETIDSITGYEEWGVKAYCHRPTLIELLGAARNKEHEGGNQGTMYLKRKQLERQIEEEADRFLDVASEQLFESLKSKAARWVINESLPKQATGREEDMLINVAFLVPNSSVQDFCQAVEEFEGGPAAKGISVEASGPWPPYHFAQFSEEEHE